MKYFTATRSALLYQTRLCYLGKRALSTAWLLRSVCTLRNPIAGSRYIRQGTRTRHLYSRGALKANGKCVVEVRASLYCNLASWRQCVGVEVEMRNAAVWRMEISDSNPGRSTPLSSHPPALRQLVKALLVSQHANDALRRRCTRPGESGEKLEEYVVETTRRTVRLISSACKSKTRCLPATCNGNCTSGVAPQTMSKDSVTDYALGIGYSHASHKTHSVFVQHCRYLRIVSWRIDNERPMRHRCERC